MEYLQIDRYVHGKTSKNCRCRSNKQICNGETGRRSKKGSRERIKLPSDRTRKLTLLSRSRLYQLKKVAKAFV